MKVSFVIPVYNNAGSLARTHAEISGLFANELREHDYEIVFVDDGSRDTSLQELLDVRSRDARVKVVTFTRNFGQMAAMLAGFREASGDVTINVSADLQDPIELVPKMVHAHERGNEIVICHRIARQDTFSAKLLSRIAYSVLRLALPQIPPGGFDFVLMSKRVLQTFNAIDVRHRFFQGDLLWTGYQTAFIPYARQKRATGRSQYNFAKKLKNFIDAILDSSYLPIRFMSLAGIVTAALGLLYGATIIVAWAIGSTPFEGWAPIMMALLVVGGLIMVMLGIIGEYLWRIYEEVRQRPNYLIKDKHF